MDKIVVKKKNHVFLEIETDSGIQMELSEHFCFYVDGYKFMPAYRKKMWDGKIRLFDTRAKTLYTGLFKYLKEFADVRQYDIIVEDNSFYGRPDTEEVFDIDNLLSEIALTAQGTVIEPRDYQQVAVTHAMEQKQSLLLSPTASGKSLIIYLCMREFLAANDGNVLLIVPTTSLVEQMYSDFADYSSTDEEWNVEDECYKIYGGKDKYNVKNRVIISTWQSIYKEKTPWFEDFGMVIGDEAHNFKAKSLTSILEKCHNAKYRLGTTGTLDGAQINQLVLEGLFGPVYKVTTTKKLMDDEALADLDISVLLLKYEDEYCREVSKMRYQQELDFIVQYEPRNNFITNLALDQEGNTLILFNYVEKHGKPLYNMLSQKLEGMNTKKKVYYVSGETDVDTREGIRAITEESDGAIIVASVGTFSTGINIRRLHNIIFASPSKSQVRVLQSIGRGLRKSDDGRDTQVFDIADDLHWKSTKNYTLKHAGKRIQIYTTEQFKYKIFEIKI
jgi:superfamily II DNA or RNA helicase